MSRRSIDMASSPTNALFMLTRRNSFSKEKEPMEEELEFLLTDDFKAFVKDLCEDADNFLSFPLEILQKSSEPLLEVPEPSKSILDLKFAGILGVARSRSRSLSFSQGRFGKRKEKHMTSMLSLVPELGKLYGRIVPSKMSEDDFWRVYFHLTKRKSGSVLQERRSNPLLNEKSYWATRRPVILRKMPIEVKNTDFWTELLDEKNVIDPADLKASLSEGIPDYFRAKIWWHLSGGLAYSNAHPDVYEQALLKSFDAGENTTVNPESVAIYLSYNPDFTLKSYYLSQQGIESFHRILWTSLSHSSAEQQSMLRHRPQFADLIALLLHFLSEEQTYCVFQNWWNDPKFQKYSQLDFSMISQAVWTLLEDFSPEAAQHMKDIKGDTTVLQKWLSRFFVDFFPLQTVFDIFDVYLLEGVTALLKIALSFLLELDRIILYCQDASELKEHLVLNAQSYVVAQTLIQQAFQLPLDDDRINKVIRKVKLESLPNFEGTSSILTNDQFATIWEWLPNRYHLHFPQKVFSTEVDGFNLTTLLLKCSNVSPSILVIKAKNGSVFGGFITSSWEEGNAYHGSGEMFVFSLSPNEAYFPWTKANDFFFMIQDRHVILGGGGGYAIWLDEEFDKGLSETCSTFENEPLSGTREFECVSLEVFALIPC